ncbi:MAG: hypothetical protein PHQ72_02625 [Hespellia sp.]|nr:hypothetical protein [Hespellia sp.]
MKYKIEYDHAIERWEDSLPLGNGKTGCLIWGKPSFLRFSLDQSAIWDTTPPKGISQPEFTYPNLVRLAREKNIEEIRSVFDAPYNAPVPTKLPVGKLFLKFRETEKMHAELRLADAQAEIRISDKQNRAVHIRSFVHAASDYGRIFVDLPSDEFGWELKNPDYGDSNDKDCCGEQGQSLSHGTQKDLHYPRAVHVQKEISDHHILEYFTQPVSEEFAYGVFVCIHSCNRSTELVYHIATSKNGNSWIEDAIQLAVDAAHEKYDQAVLRHAAWWEQYWSESSIDIPDKFMEKNWYLSNYFLACCSRSGNVPMALQGVWTADTLELPPWKGDYHNDLNVQMSYYSYLKANHMTQGIVLTEYLANDKIRAKARDFAEEFYESGGICLPAVMTIDAQPLGGWPMYSLSPTNQIWLCQSFVDVYRYSGSDSFLREKAYPYLRDTAMCILGILREDSNGNLILPISSSPEIHDDEITSFLIPNSNYDQSLLHYLFHWLICFAEKLQLEELEEWKSCYLKLKPLAVDQDDVLMLSGDERLRESHRHFSHAHAIHPLRLIEWDKEEDRKIITATIRNLEQLGTNQWVGFSFCWMAELYTIAEDGEKAAEQLRIFWKHFCGKNGFHLNGDQSDSGYSDFTYHPFTLEANMCSADALQEMLFFMKDGVMKLFPAVPDEWKKGIIKFDGFRGENGITVSAALEHGVVTRLEIDSPVQQKVKIQIWNQEGKKQWIERHLV